MENRQAAQQYSREGFKVHPRFVMPCRARKLSSQVGKKQGILFHSLAGTLEEQFQLVAAH